MGGLFSYFLSFNLFPAQSQGSYTCQSAHSTYTLVQFHRSTNKTLDIMSRVSFFPCRRNLKRLGNACVVEILCMYKFSMWMEIKTFLRPNADMNMAETSGGSVKTAYTAAWPVKACVGFTLLFKWLGCGGITWCCHVWGQNKVELWGEPHVVPLLWGFRRHKRVRVSSVHGPPSTLFPIPQQNLPSVPLASVCGPEVGLNKSAVTSGAGLLGLPEG